MNPMTATTVSHKCKLIVLIIIIIIIIIIFGLGHDKCKFPQKDQLSL